MASTKSEFVEGRIARVNWHGSSKFNPGKKFLIATLDNGMSIKGDMNNPRYDETYRFFGVRKFDPKYGEFFAFDSFEAVIDRSVNGVAQYLSRNVRGLGERLSTRLVEHLGMDTLTILRSEPERALEVKGIDGDVVDSIKAHFDSVPHDPQAVTRMMDLFRNHKFPRKLAEKLVQDFGSDAPDVVLKNPYILLAYKRVGWKGVDEFAIQTAGYPLGGLGRQRGAIGEAIKKISEDGHTYCTEMEAVNKAFELIHFRVTGEAIDSLVEDGTIVRWEGEGVTFLAVSELYYAEQTIAESIGFLLGSEASPLEPIDVEGLEPEQAEAVRKMIAHPLSLLTGGPGTGKTYTIANALEGMIAQGVYSIAVGAPTGKAAKRAEETLVNRLGRSNADVKFATIHRLLGFQPGGEDGAEGVPEGEGVKRGRGVASGFMYNDQNKLPYQVIVIDELSMVDVLLFRSLLRAIAGGTRVILVGDQDQLPSVGPGSVIRDLLGRIPTTELTTVRRNAGQIVKGCHALKHNDIPIPSATVDLANGQNWIHLELTDPQQIHDQIVALHQSVKTFDPRWGMQVVSPQNTRLPIACDALNESLGDLINPPSEAPDYDQKQPPFRVGDKVVRTKNGLVHQLINPQERIEGDYLDIWDDRERKTWYWQGHEYELRQTLIVNGDMGDVLDIVTDPRSSSAVVQLKSPDRIVRISMSDPHLQKAYALTAHKCVHPDTIVETSNGLMPIRQLPRIGGWISTPGGRKAYRNFVANPEADALRIVTSGGYEVTVTPDHKVEVWGESGYEMTTADYVREGQMVRVRLGWTCDPKSPSALPEPPEADPRAVIYDTPDYVTSEFAEFLGLMVADGTVFRAGFRLVKSRKEVIERFALLCESIFGATPRPIEVNGTPGYEVSSTFLAAYLLSLGGLEPKAKDVPECIMRSPIAYHRPFLRGLFEDGSAQLSRCGNLDHILWSSAYPGLVLKVRIMLLRMGIITGSVKDRPDRLYIYGYHARKFGTEIGFITQEKQDRCLLSVDSEKRYRIPVSKDQILPLRNYIGSGRFTLAIYQHALHRGYLSREVAKQLVLDRELPFGFLDYLEDEGLAYHHVTVTKIENVSCPSMCVEVPDVHRFFQNGFPFGNCQGSGFSYVIVPVSTVFYWNDKNGSGLFSREWLYTAMSRAEQLLVTVGEFKAIEAASRRRTTHLRRTRLGFLPLEPRVNARALAEDIGKAVAIEVEQRKKEEAEKAAEVEVCDLGDVVDGLPAARPLGGPTIGDAFEDDDDDTDPVDLEIASVGAAIEEDDDDFIPF